MRSKGEEGQAIIIVALAMSIFLIGAVGLAIDGGHIYAQRQMAQTAADAAAQAGIQIIFTGTIAGTGGAGFSTGSSFTCSTSDARTPCVYASKNGFGGSASDTVTVDFPDDTAAPGVSFSTDPTNLIRVTVARNVNTTLMGMLGSTVSTVKATAMAAIVSVVAPVPILITHPKLPGSFSTNGGVQVTICGGPPRSIQVNSGDGTATTTNGGGTVDLSHAGPPDPGDCSTGTGADVGVYGGPSTPSFTFLKGSTGHYWQPAEPILDPLAGVAAPDQTKLPAAPFPPTDLADGVSGCPNPSKKPCQLYSPGVYPIPSKGVTGGIDGKLHTVIFKPGIYYIPDGGVTCAANCEMYMATGFTDDIGSTTGTKTGWTGNIMIYNSGTGVFNLGANGTINLVGSPANSAYKGILFFQDRSSQANTGKNAHSLGGGGGLNLKGTIYMTNTLNIMNDAAHYQELDLQGTPGSTTLIQGEVIVGALHMGGNAGITMNLNSDSTLKIRQIAMVN
jgi:Flp pilus assembly protein TadG